VLPGLNLPCDHCEETLRLLKWDNMYPIAAHVMEHKHNHFHLLWPSYELKNTDGAITPPEGVPTT